MFPSQDPPTALRSASENHLVKKRYMQAECTVIELTCVDKSERSIGFVHTIPGIMISAGALQANDVINATAAAPKQQLSRRYILQAAVTTSQMQYLRNSRENQPRGEVPKNAFFRGGVKILISTS